MYPLVYSSCLFYFYDLLNLLLCNILQARAFMKYFLTKILLELLVRIVFTYSILVCIYMFENYNVF
jgi:hypothetical protein